MRVKVGRGRSRSEGRVKVGRGSRSGEEGQGREGRVKVGRVRVGPSMKTPFSNTLSIIIIILLEMSILPRPPTAVFRPLLLDF